MSSCWGRTKIKQINIYIIYMAKKNLIVNIGPKLGQHAVDAAQGWECLGVLIALGKYSFSIHLIFL